jgi:hypothetical protein
MWLAGEKRIKGIFFFDLDKGDFPWALSFFWIGVPLCQGCLMVIGRTRDVSTV